MKLDTLYNKVPVWAQNLMVTGYGAKLYYERYFGLDRSFLAFLQKNQWNSADEIEAQQVKSLRDLVKRARQQVPYYREVLDLDPDSITSLADLRRLPLLGKETLRTQTERFLAGDLAPRDMVAVNTSGTTGKTLRVCIDLESRRKAYAFFSRYHGWAGLENSRRNATFGGRTIVPQGQRDKAFWRYNAVMGNYLFSTYHMSDANLPSYVEKLREIRPQYIEAYPSAVYLLAKFMEEKGLDGVRPKAVLTSGETVFEHQREIVERVFGCRLFDQYGCTEQAHFVSQCEMGSYHVHPEYGIVEILDEEDRPVGPGGTGRVVCTSFANNAMPLIRYDLGDTAEMGPTGCGCGRHFPRLGKICGRKDDYIRTPDGSQVGRLDPIFKSVTSVKLAQIVQTDLSHLAINLVPGDSYCPQDGEIIRHELLKRVGGEMAVEVNLVREIPMSKNGKFKAVVSLLPPEVPGYSNYRQVQ